MRNATVLRLIVVLITSIFLGELLIMLAFAALPSISPWTEAIIDAVLISIFCGPIVYIFVFRPMKGHISEINQTKSQLRTAAAAFETHEAIMITDANTNIVRVNRAFERITGYCEAEVIGKTPQILKSGNHNKDFYKEMWQAILTTGTWNGEIWDKHKNGSLYPKQATISAVKNVDGDTIQYVSNFYDITERKAAEAQIEFLAYHDALTGLPNRRLAVEHLELAIAYAELSGS
jgi:PAS domain S-box-containing protein